MKTKLFNVLMCLIMGMSLPSLHAADLSKQAGNFKLTKPEVRPIFLANPILLEIDGATLFEVKGIKYFVATGSTVINAKRTPTELLRRRTVTKTKAHRAAAEFLKGIKVDAETKSFQKIVEITGGEKTEVKILIWSKKVDES